MNIEEIYTYCISKRGVEETTPFDDVTIVFKVGGKMFSLLPTDSEEPFVNLKCDPERAVELRELYEAITPGYHMNKKHWNSVYFSRGDIPESLLTELIDHSYDLVYDKLPKKTKLEIDALY